MLTSRTVALVVLAGAMAAPVIAQDAARESDHRELRAMLFTVRDAINQQKLDAIDPLIVAHPSIVLADAQLVTDLPGLKSYFQQLVAPGGPLKSITLNPVADSLTEFVSGDVGICHGTSDDTFVLRNGTSRVLRSRWTATLVKQEGRWKLAQFQATINALDNPILDEYRRGATTAMAGAAVLAILGAGAGWAIGRRRRA